MSVDHASAVAAPKSDPVFLHVKAGMTVIVADTDGAWRMADVIWVDGGARNPKIPTLFQVADVDTGVVNWINADFVTHICPRALQSGVADSEYFCSLALCHGFLMFVKSQICRPSFNSTKPCASAFGNAN